MMWEGKTESMELGVIVQLSGVRWVAVRGRMTDETLHSCEYTTVAAESTTWHN